MIFSVSLVGGCLQLHPDRSVVSCRDTKYFAQPPVVVRRGERYLLAWTQGSYPYYFTPDYWAVDGGLVVALAAGSSSTGTGHRQEREIEGAANLAALRRGGACWLEPPSGPCVRLELVE